MRYMSFLLSTVSFLLAMSISGSASESTDGPNEQSDGHAVGDCLVGGNFSSCRSFLQHKTSKDGIDYLAERSCPGCVDGPTVYQGDGSPLVLQKCPANNGWSIPNNDNLDVANEHYDHAGDGQTGAVVTGFDERDCWEGGTCFEGMCVQYDTGDVVYRTGERIYAWQCQTTGVKMWYIMKKFEGSTCTNDMNEGMDGMPGETSGDPAVGAAFE